MIRALHWLDRLSPFAAGIIGVILICSIGVFSIELGPQLSGSFLYLIPILLVTRIAGFRAGNFAAVLAAVIWLGAELNAGMNIEHPVIPYWNLMMRMGTFLVMVSLVAAMRTLNAELEERVIERTAELEAQIDANRHLEKTILDVSDLEQARIGQDLHDGLCQHLVSAAFSANMLQQSLAKDSAPESRDAERIADMIDDSITQARNLARGLYPVRLETEGLEMALRELASTLGQRFDIPCTVECHDAFPPCGANTGIHLYRIAQEAVTNAAKHANARNILIHLSADSLHFLLKIQDDGIGIDRSNIEPRGMGLSIMEYRARMIGADLRVTRLTTGGTEVVCELRVEG